MAQFTYSKDAANSYYGRSNQTNEQNSGHCYIGNYYNSSSYYYGSGIQFNFAANAEKNPLVVAPGTLKFSLRPKGNGSGTGSTTTATTFHILSSLCQPKLLLHHF